MRTKVFILLAAAVLAGTAVPSAAAEPQNSVEIRWDDEATGLDWTGRGHAIAVGSFLGTTVVSPGDRATRTAVVTNVGPSAATARVELIDVSIATPPEAVNTDLQDCVRLFLETGGKTYEATWREAAQAGLGGPGWSVAFEVPLGASFPVTAGAYFPAEETGGRPDGRPSQQLSFTVRVTLTGEIATPASPQIRTGGSVKPA